VPALAARAPPGGNEGRDRYCRTEDRLDHAAHRGVEAAGRIQLQDDQLLPCLGRTRNAAHDVVGGGRGDGAVDRQQADALGSRSQAWCQHRQPGQHQCHRSEAQWDEMM
jgi:hypothetical protein